MEFTVLQQIILGIIQGFTEWLPISSSGISIFVMSRFFGVTDLGFLLHAALFLHLGTFLAALIYLRKDVVSLVKSVFRYKSADRETKGVLKFLIIATVVSGVVGLLILLLLSSLDLANGIAGKFITFFIGISLLFTAFIQLTKKRPGLKTEYHLKTRDGIVLGLAQGAASLPGVSRSGITISSLLLKRFNDTTALRLSFLMSLPIVLIGNIFLNLSDFTFSTTAVYGLIFSFAVGFATIHGLMQFSRRINFGWFALAFAVLMLLSLLI